MKKFRLPLFLLLGISLLTLISVAVAYRTKIYDTWTTSNNPEKPAAVAQAAPVVPVQATYTGKIINAQTKAPIVGAIITLGDVTTQSSADGAFSITGKAELLRLRAPGYARQDMETSALPASGEIALTPFQVKALYLSTYGASSDKIRNAALDVIKTNHMNALVIDVKGDRGFIPFKVNIPLAQEIGAQDTILIQDMPAFVAGLKQQGLYLIARIVTFKDDKLAAARPQWAVKKGNDVFRDREKLRWVDPFLHEVWDYNIAIAKAAAELGFDEVQFDYVRCPDAKGVVFSQPSTQEARSQTITGFLQAAHKALAPSNVMVAADIFGYVAWDLDDTGIGQEIDKVIHVVDVVSLMLYPSGFSLGLPNYRNPVAHPYETVYLTLKRAQNRTGVSALRFRPWLQAFRDYAFHGGDFGVERLRQQIKAAQDFGASGYMFWNPRNVYLAEKFVE